MGPVFGGYRVTTVDAHRKCQNAGACKGPGCKYLTGKTEKKRRKEKRHGN